MALSLITIRQTSPLAPSKNFGPHHWTNPDCGRDNSCSIDYAKDDLNCSIISIANILNSEYRVSADDFLLLYEAHAAITIEA
jgi:hypothetical protein